MYRDGILLKYLKTRGEVVAPALTMTTPNATPQHNSAIQNSAQSPWSDSPGTPRAKQSLSSIKEHDEEEFGKYDSGSQERLEGKEK